MTRKRLLARIGAGAILCVGATLYWYLGHRPIAFHNECIRSAIEAAVRIEVSTKRQTAAPDGTAQPRAKEATVTNREEIVGMLNHLKLPWSMRASRKSHECAGHLRIKIIMPNLPNYDVQYDHGIGIYPVHAGRDNPGFCHLPEESCDYLNHYFTQLGYDKGDLGMHR